jgi:hypothetical protein
LLNIINKNNILSVNFLDETLIVYQIIDHECNERTDHPKTDALRAESRPTFSAISFMADGHAESVAVRLEMVTASARWSGYGEVSWKYGALERFMKHQGGQGGY